MQYKAVIDTKEYIANRAKRARKSGLREVLDKVPAREPLVGDQL